MILGTIFLILGAVVSCVLYFLASLMRIFSPWAGGLGVLISLGAFSGCAEKSNKFVKILGFILGIVLNCIALALAEALYTSRLVAKELGVPFLEAFKNFDYIYKFMLDKFEFWKYPVIGMIFILVGAIFYVKEFFKSEPDEDENKKVVE